MWQTSAEERAVNRGTPRPIPTARHLSLPAAPPAGLRRAGTKRARCTPLEPARGLDEEALLEPKRRATSRLAYRQRCRVVHRRRAATILAAAPHTDDDGGHPHERPTVYDQGATIPVDSIRATRTVVAQPASGGGCAGARGDRDQDLHPGPAASRRDTRTARRARDPHCGCARAGTATCGPRARRHHPRPREGTRVEPGTPSRRVLRRQVGHRAAHLLTPCRHPLRRQMVSPPSRDAGRALARTSQHEPSLCAVIAVKVSEPSSRAVVDERCPRAQLPACSHSRRKRAAVSCRRRRKSPACTVARVRSCPRALVRRK